MTRRPVTGGRQHRTPETITKAFQGPCRLLSRGRQNIRGHLWHTLKIYRKFTGE